MLQVSITEAAGSWGWVFCAGCVLLVAWKLLRSDWRKWRRSLVIPNPKWGTRWRGSSYWLSMVLVIILSSFFAWVAYASIRPANFVLMHNVHVLKRTSELSFRAEVEDPANGEWTKFVVVSCPEWKPTNEIQAGVTLPMLQYVEDHVRGCMVLDGRWGGYTILRGDDDKPIHKDF